MNGCVKTVAAFGLLTASVTLLACAGTTSLENGAVGSEGIDGSDSPIADTTSDDAQSVAENAGLGVVNEGGEKTVRCRNRRSTGSHLSKSNCAGRDDIDGQPIREGLNLPGLDVKTGTGQTRPSH